MMTNPSSLIEEAQQRAERVDDDRRRRRGAEEYEAALAPAGEAARARIAARRAMMTDGVSVKALQAAVPTFGYDPSYESSPAAAELRKQAHGTLRQALELLTEARCVQDEALIQRKVEWTDNDWSRPEWIRVNIADLDAFVPGPPDVRGVLDLVPWWESEIRRRLAHDEIRPSPTRPAAPSRQARAASGTVDA